MVRLRTALARGFRFRCPICGEWRFYRFWCVFAPSCERCGHVFIRDPGDWTGSAETAFILTVLLGGGVWLATEGWGLAPLVQDALAIGIALLGFGWMFPRLRGVWIGVLALWADPRHGVPAGVDPVEGHPEFQHPSLTGRP
ncbi:MAG: DUF983 domain-containing protein [Thermoplasmatota archaeon]